MSAPSPIQAVLLAAGLSTRMGETNKLLLPYRGQPIVRCTAEALLAAGVEGLVVVTGHDAEAVGRALSGLALRTVFNPAYRDGQSGSVQVGAAALQPGGDGIMIALGDMPFLTAADYRLLMEAFRSAGSDRIAVPTFDGERGNPIIIPARLHDDLVGDGRIGGCRRLIEKRPDDVLRVPVMSSAFVRDVDTPDAYRAEIDDGAAAAPRCC